MECSQSLEQIMNGNELDIHVNIVYYLMDCLKLHFSICFKVLKKYILHSVIHGLIRTIK